MGIDATQIEEYRPPWALHVRGVIYPPDDQSTRLIECYCEHPRCNGFFKVACNSGRVRQHINNFAKAHVHRDAFNNPTRNPLEDR
jgi:hypothetical protein